MPNRSLTPALDCNPALKPLIAAFLDWARVERSFSEETTHTYGRSLERFFTEANIQAVEAISANDVLRFKRLVMNRGCSPSYLAGIVLALRSFLTYCSQVQGAVVLDPKTITPPSRPRRAVTFLTPEEVQRFVGAIKLGNRWAGRRRQPHESPRGLLYRALVEVLLGTGLRVSEVLGLRARDIDWVQQEARIVGKGQKERVVFFTDRALDWLRQYLDRRPRTSGTDRVFIDVDGAPLTRAVVGRWFRRQTSRAGINKAVTAHVLRHTVATTLMFNGCPMGHIKEILGHERLDTTCRYYLGLDVRRARLAHRQYLTYECAASGTS